MKNKIFVISYIFITVIFILFQIFKYDLLISANMKSFGFEVMLGLLDYFIYMLYAILIVISIIFATYRTKIKKGKAFIPILICAFILFLIFIFPTTNIYESWNYEFNKRRRTEIVEMAKNGKLSDYIISTYEYKVPFRSASYTGTIFVQENYSVIKIMFYICQSFEINKVLVYVSDDSGIELNDFNFDLQSYTQNFSGIKKMDNNWYIAIINPRYSLLEQK